MTNNDSPAQTDGSPTTAVSRRGTLAALAAAGLFGLGSGATAVTGSTEREEIDLAGETVFSLTGPQTTERADGSRLRDGGTVRIGSQNEIGESVIGGTVSGGGVEFLDQESNDPNVVGAHFGTVGGGAGNEAGTDGSAEDGSYATVGGGLGNIATGGGSTVSGGTNNDASGHMSTIAGGRQNSASEPFAVTGGGLSNDADGQHATVTGGTGNSALDESATVAGGQLNSSRARQSTVVGGRANVASGRASTVVGGSDNTASGSRAVAAGGRGNTAAGDRSFAAGYSASTSYDGSFVWGDSTDTEVTSAADDQVVFQASGGIYIGDDDGPEESFAAEKLLDSSTGAYLSAGGTWTDSSSRTAKRDIDPVDEQAVLDGVESLSISEWRYDVEPETRHMGPMAEEFHETFGLGPDEKHIASLDTAGVALAAIKALSERLAERTEQVEKSSGRIEELEAENERLQEQNADLEQRLLRLEDELGITEPAAD